MGCGGDVLESGQVFRMYVAFFNPETTEQVELDPTTYASLVAEINGIVSPGNWDTSDQCILLRGPIATSDEAHHLNRTCNGVLKRLRVDSNGRSTGKAG